MEWLDKRLDEHRHMSQAHGEIVSAAPSIYDEVWKAIMEVARAANGHGMNIAMNGFPLHYTVKMGERSMKLELAEDKCSIAAAASDLDTIILSLRNCEDATVCIRYCGRKLSYAEAAQEIMEPFLFGGQSPYTVPVASGKD